MTARAIETRGSPAHPLGLAADDFLATHWQKSPLLVRGAFADFTDPLTPEDLAGLSCESLTLSRIVVHEPKRDRWTLRTGPFDDADFAALPSRDWTLLVQDVDKWDADVATLMRPFSFLPRWRIDDVMVSYAVDGGSVGAHVDRYDVFLLQGRGRRRWRISVDAGAPAAFRDDAEIRLLKTFEPTHEWTLEAGDLLYLPPGVAHEGVAIGEAMTYSIGMRAPSCAELMTGFADSFAATLDDGLRYEDADLAPAHPDGEIDDAAFERVARAMPWLKPPGSAPGAIDAEAFKVWFGSFITSYRSAHAAQPRGRPLGDAALEAARARGALAIRNPFSRAAWCRASAGAHLFVAGDGHRSSIGFARKAAGADAIEVASIDSARDLAVLRALIDAGHFALTAPPRRRSRT